MVDDHGPKRFLPELSRRLFIALSLPEEEFMSRNSLLVLALALVLAIPALAADVAGKWTASFDTQIGVQNYTYTFKVDDAKLTGTAESQLDRKSVV